MRPKLEKMCSRRRNQQHRNRSSLGKLLHKRNQKTQIAQKKQTTRKQRPTKQKQYQKQKQNQKKKWAACRQKNTRKPTGKKQI